MAFVTFPYRLVTITVHVPKLLDATLVITNEPVVAPEISIPFEIFVPFWDQEKLNGARPLTEIVFVLRVPGVLV